MYWKKKKGKGKTYREEVSESRNLERIVCCYLNLEKLINLVRKIFSVFRHAEHKAENKANQEKANTRMIFEYKNQKDFE